MSRPSAMPPVEPDYKPTQAPEGFTLPKVPESTAPAISATRNLHIKQILVEGNTVISSEQLQELTRPYQGRKVSVADLEELRQRLTRFYIDRGYINSGAVIPPQSLADGILRLRIVEGRLTEVKLKGQGGLRAGYIKNRLWRDGEAPLNLQELQDNFQLLLSDPLIGRMNGRLLPGAAPGQSIMELDVLRARPYHLELFGDNYRPPSIGAEAFGLNAWVRDLTGQGDVLDFTYITSAASERFAGGFSLPIGDFGTTAFFRFDEGDSFVLEEAVRELKPTSLVHSLEGGISQTLIDTLKQRFSIGASLAVRENETFLAGQPFSFISTLPIDENRNQATVLRIYQDYQHRWERQVLSLHSGFSVGLDALGATPQTNRKFQDGEFFSWLGQLYYAFRVLDNGAQFAIRSTAQFSDDPLLPLERIAIGGVNSVRGYRENMLVRDQGYSVSGEFHYPLYGAEPGARHRLTLIPFMDYGQAWDHGGESDVLHSVGVGLNWQLQPLQMDFYYGYALKRSLKRTFHGDLQDDGIHFQVRLDVL